MQLYTSMPRTTRSTTRASLPWVAQKARLGSPRSVMTVRRRAVQARGPDGGEGVAAAHRVDRVVAAPHQQGQHPPAEVGLVRPPVLVLPAQPDGAHAVFDGGRSRPTRRRGS